MVRGIGLIMLFALAGCADVLGIEPGTLGQGGEAGAMAGAGGTGAGGGGSASGGAGGAGAAGGSGGLMVSYEEMILDDDPIAFWRLNEGAGDMALSLTGAHHGTYEGNDYSWTDGATSDGDAAVALVEDPQADTSYVAIPDHLDLDFADRAPFSIEVWFRLDAMPTDRDPGLVTKRVNPTGGPSDGWTLVVSDTNALVFRRFRDDSVDRCATGDNALMLHTFYHAVATYDGMAMRLYLDGIEVDSENPATQILLNNDRDVFLGAQHASNNGIDGVIDDVSIYDYALTGPQVSAHHAAGL